MTMTKIAPCLWFDGQGDALTVEAALAGETG
jgi:hypothetical protein